MVRYKRRRARYGLPAGALSFIGGWAVVAFLTPTSLMPSYPRWQVTLWVYLGAHFVELSDVHTGGLGFSGLTVEEYAAGVPIDSVPLVAVVAVAVAATYTCYEFSTSRVKHNVRNAITAGTGYFLTALAALILSDMQPAFTVVLMFGLLVGGGIWVGSSFIEALTRGMPFIGIATLGTIATVGILILIGGLSLISTIWGIIVISYGVAVVTGFGVGVSRKLEHRGQRTDGDGFARIRGLKWVLVTYRKPIIASLVVLLALFIGLGGGI